jgi:hypothetical protein
MQSITKAALFLSPLLLVPLLLSTNERIDVRRGVQRVSLNGRLAPASSGGGEDALGNQRTSFEVPLGYTLVVTDIFVQNRSPGDEPVVESESSRLFLSGDPNDWVATVVGNTALALHFSTGIEVREPTFRILNAVSSSAPFIEYQINGFLERSRM